MKILNGTELAGFIKERQAHQVAGLRQAHRVTPTLAIIRDSDNPVIAKYVSLKQRYGDDIGVQVLDCPATSPADIEQKILEANDNPDIHGIILQLPLATVTDKAETDRLTALIAPGKDVDGLSGHGDYDSATATAIIWLLAGYDIKLNQAHIAIVGRGKLVGAPLYQMFTASNYDVTLFHRGDDLTKLKNFDIIISATGVPGLISDDLVSPGAVFVDAGTASEKGILKGDVADAVRDRKDLAAITPAIGGVGPLTVTCLFDHLLTAANKTTQPIN